MQVDWTLPEQWECQRDRLEGEADAALGSGDIERAWRCYAGASEASRQADAPVHALRLTSLAEALVHESSIPWAITRIHASAALSAMGRGEEALRHVEGIQMDTLPPSLQALYADTLCGLGILNGFLEMVEVNLLILSASSDCRGQLSASFRQCELYYLNGMEAECLKSVRRAETLLVNQNDNGAGRAALSMLKAELFVLREDWMGAERAYKTALLGFQKCGRLGPSLSAASRLAWVAKHLEHTYEVEFWCRALKWADRRGLKPLSSGLLVALALNTVDESKQRDLFVRAWNIADGHGLSLMGARARYLYGVTRPSEDDVPVRLREAMALSGLSKPLQMLIEREMC